MISCRGLVRLLFGYVGKELPAEHHELVHAHLAHCRDCVAYADSYRRIIQLARRLPPVPLPYELLRKLYDDVERQQHQLQA